MSKREVGRRLRVGDLEIPPHAQRKLDMKHAERIAGRFDPDLVVPKVSIRGQHSYILDAQHGVQAGLICGAFTPNTELECIVWSGLTEAEEAEKFLQLNAGKAVGTFDKFRIGRNAHRPDEIAIAQAVQDLGLNISRGKQDGCIAAIGGLRFVFGLGGDTVLRRALSILNEAYGGDPAGFQVHLLKGMGLVCQRYDGQLDADAAAKRLASLTGGTVALTRKANGLKLKTGHDKADCMAAAIVETLNRGHGGKKLESWWR